MRKESSAAISIRSAVSASSRAISLFSIRLRRVDCPVRLHMDQHVRYPLQVLFYFDPNLGGDVMRLPHGEFRIDFQVQVDMILEACLPRVTFFDGEGAGDAERYAANLAHHEI